MAELLVKATDAININPDKDLQCYKRGMPVVVMPDGHPWGLEERLPSFVIVKIPGVAVDRVQKYITPEYTVSAESDSTVYRRRMWQIRWSSLPVAARNKLTSTGELIIKTGTYDGIYDYTWQQVKGYFRNLFTGLDEAEDL